MRKRFLSLTLALVMALALLPTAALATDITITEAIPCKYKEVKDFSEGLAAVCLNDKWGFVDKTGKEVVPCKYSSANSFSEGLAAVCLNEKWGFVDKTGKEVVPCKYMGVEDFFEGLAIVMVDSGETHWGLPVALPNMGFIDKTGQEVIPCKYRSVKNFNEGLAAVKQNGKWGFIDKIGQEVTPIQYDEVRSFSDGVAKVCIGSNWGLINKTGREIFPCKYESEFYVPEFCDGLAVVKGENGKYGYIDMEGNEVIPRKYSVAYPFSEGRAVVGISEKTMIGEKTYLVRKYGYIDITGQEVTPLIYDSADSFSGGLAAVRRLVETRTDFGTSSSTNGGYIDTAGNEVFLIPGYTGVYGFSDGFAVGKNAEGKYGIIDQTGKEIVPFQYDELSDFLGGVAIADVVEESGNKKHILVDKTGHEICSLEYTHISCGLSEGLTMITTRVGTNEYGLPVLRCGAFDEMGNEIVPCKYSYMTDYSGGIAVVATGELPDGYFGKQLTGYGCVDRMGRLFSLPREYSEVHSFSEGLAAVRLNDKWGFISVSGDIAPTAYAATQSVLVDGSPVEFQAYALKDAAGNDTNYIKLRDVASVLSGTGVQFNVGWDGAVNIETGKGYTSNGSEMKTPFSGNRAYENATAETRINGSRAALDAIVLKDDAGGAYTYYKLRDLGAALGFRVDWSAETGIFIETK